MIINHNMMAMNTHRQLGVTGTNQSKSMEKLSSGLRINRAGDDAAGLSISEKMRGQIRGLNQASRNAQDGISLIQTAEGALTETHSILQRMRELAVQSANDTNKGVDRSEIQKEVNQLIDEIDRIAENTQFNEQNLLDGSFKDKKFHIGANEDQNITLSIKAMGSGGATASSVNITQDTQEVAGVADQTVLKDSDKVVAVKINDKWYKKDDVEENSGSLKAKDGKDPIDVTTNKSIGGATVKEDTDTVKTVSDQTVYKNTDNDIVAVKVNNKWYKTDDVEVDSGTLKVIDSKLPLTIEETYSINDDSNKNSDNGLNVDSLKVKDATKDSIGGIMTQTSASSAIKTIQSAIETVSAERSKLGAYQNRLEHTIKNLDTSSENLQASESRIRDVDMAQEMMNLTKNNILQQAAQSMLAQANQAPQGVLSLLR